MVTERLFPDAEALASALADRAAAELRAACQARGQAALVLSGGRSPERFLQQLSSQPLPWDRIWVTLADERWVDPGSADSNQALVRRALLQGEAAGARFVPLKNAAPTPLGGQPAAEAALQAVPRPFDLVVLGMGDDGHTASLFPGAPQLPAALDRASPRLCIAVDPVSAPHPRLSLTLPALLGSRQIALQLSGARKWDIYQQARRPGSAKELPIRAILQQDEVPVDVYWSA